MSAVSVRAKMREWVTRDCGSGVSRASCRCSGQVVRVVGESGRTVQYAKSREQTMADLRRSFEAIGRVTEYSEVLGTVSGKCRYGLQSVKLRVSVVEETPSRCLVQVQGFADDIWGAGARAGTDKLLAEMAKTPLDLLPAGTGEGWYADPSGRHPDRWWEGAAWTHWVRDKPGGTRTEDPPFT
jgi:hypothetical protein